MGVKGSKFSPTDWEVVQDQQQQPLRLQAPVYITDRVLAFAYEDARLDASRSERKRGVDGGNHGYVECLSSAASYLQESHAGAFMLINLGGSFIEDTKGIDAYSMFCNSCVEFVVPWNVPLGVGVCPLDILFATCSSIHNWLSMDEDHVAVLHTRTAPGGHADTFLRFVAACYLTYSIEFDHVFEAFEVVMPQPGHTPLPPDKRVRRTSFIHSPSTVTMNSPLKKERKGWFAKASLSSLSSQDDLTKPSPSSHAYRERGGARPSQRRYGQYFMNVLHSPVLPAWQRTPVMLQRVVISCGPIASCFFHDHDKVCVERERERERERDTHTHAHTHARTHAHTHARTHTCTHARTRTRTFHS